jgi:hypothetical protein
MGLLEFPPAAAPAAFPLPSCGCVLTGLPVGRTSMVGKSDSSLWSRFIWVLAFTWYARWPISPCSGSSPGFPFGFPSLGLTVVLYGLCFPRVSPVVESSR